MTEVNGVAVQLWREEAGQGMVEYALLLALMALAAFMSLQTMGQTARTSLYDGVVDSL